MTLTFAPQTEARLQAVANQRGLSPEAALDAILAEAETEFSAAVAGIQRGMDNYDAGRWISLEDYEQQIRTQRQIRDAQIKSQQA